MTGTENSTNNMVMPVQPMNGGYGGNQGFGFGGDWAWILLLLVLGGGWGGFGGLGMGGYGAMMGMGMMDGFGIYPWMNQVNQMSDGFRDAQLHDSVTSVRDGISALATQLCDCCGNMQIGMANGFHDVERSVSGAQNAISQQMAANEVANLNRSFAEQTANMQGFNSVQGQLAQSCCDQKAATADLKYTVATEECATRNAAAMNTRDIIDSQTRGTQAILDKLCTLELDGVKSQLAQAQRENVALQNAVNMATMRESQTAQTAQILAGQAAEIDGVYNRLKNCPVPTMPVYGNTPIFTCPQNVAAGCGCGGNFN